MPCTTILVGKDASLDHAPLIARQEDYGNAFNPQSFRVILPQDQPRHYASKTTNFTCDLPENPLCYTSTPDVDSSAGVFAAGGINQANVAMTATESSTTNSRILGLDPFNQESGIGEEDFVTLVLPYVQSAREGVERLGQLLEQYGTYEANGIAFADQDEVWFLETIGGHRWAAVRIPDDAFVIAPNRFNITDFDFESATTLASPNLKDWIDQHDLNPADDGYNLQQICGSRTYRDMRYNNPRAWYVQKLFGVETGADPTQMDLPFICHPKHRLAVEDIKQAMSSHYQGTPYDPYGGEKGGQVRSIALNRNLELHVLEIRAGVAPEVAAVHWLAFGPNTFNALVPFYANVTDTPSAYRDTSGQYDPTKAYWLAHTLAAIGDHHYRALAPKVEAYEQTVTALGRQLQAAADAKAAGEADLPAFLTQVNDQMAKAAVEEGTKLLGDCVKEAFLNEHLQF